MDGAGPKRLAKSISEVKRNAVRAHYSGIGLLAGSGDLHAGTTSPLACP